MAESHSYEGCDIPLVTSSEVVGNSVALIKLCVPLNFDFKKDGAKLLRHIQSATNLFFKPGETNEVNDDDSGGDSDFGSPTKHRR